MKKINEEQGLEAPSVDPRVTIQAPVAGEIHLIVRIPTKSGQRGYIEQSIMSDVFNNNDFVMETSSDKSSNSNKIDTFQQV